MADYNAGHDPARFNPLDYPQSLELPKHASSTAWHEHIPFVKILVQLLRPKIFVKLGVRKDDSYLAICESAATLGIACYGVDGGNGRIKHAGVADDKVLSQLHAAHDPHYGTFSRVVETGGDAQAPAASHFAENSIELLHVDGLQPYKAVCRDWETWRPKLSRSAVVLFQGTNVREGDVGMWQLWKQLCFTYRHFEFLHGQGLGVIVTGPGIPEPLNVFLTMAEKNSETVRKYFFALGNRSSLHAQAVTQSETIESLETKLRDTEALSGSKNTTLLAQAAEIGRLNEMIAGLQQRLSASTADAQTLRGELEKIKAEFTEAGKLHTRITEQEQSLLALKSQLQMLQAESARLREESSRIKNSTSFKLLQSLTAPFRFFRGG
ncbi:MAG TPA: class I SAM-dependent methyltransferase [Planctomycetota bacterium]|nr:class I SAM-dependent methyltransferase [Planctomycetota bacterium]